jgi:hypothetical protein
MWAWITAACVGVLAGFLGWFLFLIVFTVQLAALGWAVGYHTLQYTSPQIPIAAFAAGCVCALIAGAIGWRLAPIAAIIQTVLFGFVGILAGMIILCQPVNTGERLLLALLVAIITIPAGTWVQWRAHKRTHLPPH